VAVHIYTRTIHRTTQITTNVEECGPCPVSTSFTLAFALQLRKKHGKTSVTVVRLRETSVRVQYTYNQNTHTLQPPPPTHTHTHYKTQTYTHTLQNNIKPPQYKLKQTQCKIYPNEKVTIFFCFNMAPDVLHENPRIVYYCQPYQFSTKSLYETLNIFVYLTLMCSSRKTTTHPHTECIFAFAL
jgi:hypothetical protein